LFDKPTAPLNTGPIAQTKSGTLTIGNTNWTQIQFYPNINDVYNPLTGGSDRAHFHFGFVNTPSGKEPLLEIPGDLWVIGNNHNLTTDGYIKSNTGLCIGSDCRTSWPSVSAIKGKNCMSLGGVVGAIDNEGNITCTSGSLPPSNFDCSFVDIAKDPTTGADTANRRIFVTSVGYKGSLITSDSAADALCQSVADEAHVKGTYKALVYIGGTVPMNKLKSGKVYYSCDPSNKVGGNPWHLVANNPTDFFTDKGGGNYLRYLITNEIGQTSASTVWTNYQPNGAGGYSLQSGTNSVCRTWYVSGWAEQATVWIGAANSTSITWAYTVKNYSTSSGSGATSNCLNETRSLYCVQQ